MAVLSICKILHGLFVLFMLASLKIKDLNYKSKENYVTGQSSKVKITVFILQRLLCCTVLLIVAVEY